MSESPEGSPSPDPVMVGEIVYANVTPIFHVLRNRLPFPGLVFRRGVPATLNGMLSRGEIDLCPSSSVLYARLPETYYLVPDLSISSVGPVKSVLLFSRSPIEELHRKTVALTTESETSVILLRVILAKFLGLDCSYVPLTENADPFRGNCEAFLLIGDSALAGARSPGAFHVYDLGELWYRFTGLPFVFALWIVRGDALERKGRAVRLLCDRLRLVKEAAVASLPRIAEETATPDMNPAYLLNYWKYLCYDLGPDHQQGLRLFYESAADLGLLPGAPELKFVS